MPHSTVLSKIALLLLTTQSLAAPLDILKKRENLAALATDPFGVLDPQEWVNPDDVSSNDLNR